MTCCGKAPNCNKQKKFFTYQAIIQAMVLYGLESAQLNASHLARLNAFQLRRLRQILKISTTYIDRTHTNDYVDKQATETASSRRKRRHIKPFSDMYSSRQNTLLAHLTREPSESPTRSCTLQSNSVTPLFNNNRRGGHPKNYWTFETLRSLWHATTSTRLSRDPALSLHDIEHLADLQLALWLHPEL